MSAASRWLSSPVSIEVSFSWPYVDCNTADKNAP